MAEKFFHLEIITPGKLCFDSDVISVTVPGTKGEFQVLTLHAPLLGTLDIGRIKVQLSENKEILFCCGGGTIEVLKDKVLILVESLEKREDIDVERAKKSAERARKRLSSTDKSKIDIARAEASLSRAMNRLKLVSK